MARPFSLSLTQRVIAVSALALLLIAALLFGAFQWQQSRRDATQPGLPLPQRVAAIAELIEASDPAQLSQVLHALATPGLQISVIDADTAVPEDFPYALPALTLLSRRYFDAMQGRELRVESRVSPRELLRNARQRAAGDAPPPLRLVVTLHDGRHLIVEPDRRSVDRLVRARVIWSALILVALIGLIAVWILHRQLQPLQALAQALEHFGATQAHTPLRESGATEVRQLVRSFNQMRTRIQDLLDNRTRMLGAISHDLGTYLTRLRLRIEFIDDATQRGRAERDLAEMHTLLKDSLSLARLEQSPEPLQRMDLAALVRQQVEPLAEAGAPVELTRTDAVEIELRPTALGRAVTNLIDNAVKYGGRAEVSVLRDADGAEIVVDDHGPGIPADERQLVLEPFYRRDAARNLNQPGAGLGLAIVADVVARHRGSVNLEDRPGGGLRVRLRLPRTQSETTASPAPT